MDATMENKMGLPPPYESTAPNQTPPPSYFGNNPPPPPGMAVPPAVSPRTTVVTAPPMLASPIKMGPGPTGTVCPTCRIQMVTRVEHVANNKTHIVAAALCVVSACCCGCLFPYCMESCKSANHYCTRCNAFVGTYQPS